MANAGCINAIWFDWTYLRTLDTLDSANIGVGVQYCIPAPLDDKRLDYIKYTDKCGCTCCITGENEILVYATNWVIKNFTLTNDDTNEVINVKWNDLFGSNRAKTIVRYKTWSYPTSITDWTLAVQETTQNQYSVSWYNVSGLTNWTTYYFTAFAVSQDGTIIVVQNKNIKTDYTFAWYQKVEYIQSSWTQYINTWISANQYLSFEADFQPLWTTNENTMFWARVGSWTNRFWLMIYSWKFHMMVGSTSSTAFDRTIDTNRHKGSVFVNNWAFTWKFDSYTDSGSAWTSVYTNKNFLIFKIDYTGWACPMRVFSFKLYTWNSNLVRDYYPVYRKSDNVIWLFDIVNRQFYTNAWTWTFTKWPNIN